LNARYGWHYDLHGTYCEHVTAACYTLGHDLVWDDQVDNWVHND